jgi:hypothetical protein
MIPPWTFLIQLLGICMIWILILEFNDSFSRDEDFERITRNKILSGHLLKNSQE